MSSPTEWRLIGGADAGLEAAAGSWNMAVDEALLLAAASDEARPALRFYRWNPYCLSIGRFQNAATLAQRSELVRDGRPGLDWVRRPTGGRAVWHSHEITYCAVVRSSLLPPEAQSVAGAYRYLSQAFIVGLESLGLPARLAPAESGEDRARAQRSANCFAVATRADFVVDGRKLIGAAQCRQNGVVLQHGSLLLDIDTAAWSLAMGSRDDSAAEVGETDAGTSMVSLRELGFDLPPERVIEALCEGIRFRLGARLHPETLSTGEVSLAKGLQVKYGGESWNLRGMAEQRGPESTQERGRAV